MAGPMTPDELRRYAQMIVRGCISFQRGDTIWMRANHAQRELAVAVAEEAYAAGAAAFDVEYEDARIFAAKITKGGDRALGRRTAWQTARLRAIGTKDVAIVHVMGEFEHGIAADLPPEKVAEDVKRLSTGSPVGKAVREGRLRGTICGWPTEDWATRVFPGISTEAAQRRLARDLLWFCRLGPDDPPGHQGWTEHLATLRRRSARLTKLDLNSVELRDHGVDLRVRLAPFSMWRGGGENDFWGRHVAPNVPTEECFISPDAASTEGTFRCSRPRSIGSRWIEGLSGEFRRGRLVRLEADNEGDRDWLARYLGSIPNADRLGEIALVDSSSRIGQRGHTYYNGLLDENAAAHMAFGSGFAKTRTVPVGRNRYGVNRSKIHIDVMIGTDDLDAVGVTQAGRRVPLITDGVWQI